MATIISAQLTPFQVAQGNETFFVPEGDFIASNARAFEFLDFDDVDLIISGQVLSDAGSFGITLGSGAFDNTITVLSSGAVVGAGDAIRNFGQRTTITNYGSITSTTASNGSNDGISTIAGDTIVTNYGEITAFARGILISTNDEDFTLTNFGRITSTGNFGVDVNTNSNIFNSGEIIGLQGGFRSTAQTNEMIVVRNTGTMGSQSEAPAVIGGDSIERIFNSGTLAGDVSLNAGDDLYQASADGVVDGTIDLGSGGDRGVGGNGNDTIDGGSGSDTIYGGVGDDVVRGGSENDTVHGGVGSDLISGDAGSDTITDGRGNDTVDGGGFNDTVEAVADGDDDLFDGSFGTDVLRLQADDGINVDLNTGFAESSRQGSDQFLNFEVIETGDGADSFVGSASDVQVFGGIGNDSFSGFGGRDEFFGGTGNDDIRGGGGNDTLNGGSGNDVLRGANGNDRFDFQDDFGIDRILDFSASNAERIDLRQVTSITSFADLVQNHLSQVGGDAVITDGPNTITIVGFLAANLDAGDFVF